MTKVKMPEAELFTHELISNGGGVHIGVGTKGICEQSYVEGETSEAVQEWVLISTLKQYGDARAREVLEMAVERIAAVQEGWGDVAEECGMSTAIATIRKLQEQLK